jgi:hypothetical protein
MPAIMERWNYVSVQGVSQLLLALAAVITAVTPIIGMLIRRKAPGHPTQSRLGDPRQWTHAAVVAALVAYAIAVVLVIYGLTATMPPMKTASMLSFRLVAEALGLLSVSSGARGVVTALHEHTRDIAVLGGTAMLGGLVVMAAMAAIA